MHAPTKAEQQARYDRIQSYVHAHPELSADMAEAITKGDICNGMTKEQVKVVNDDPPYREDETHLWYRGAWWNDLYTFKDGVLVETGRWK